MLDSLNIYTNVQYKSFWGICAIEGGGGGGGGG